MSSLDAESLPLALSLLVEQLCLRFEAACRAGQHPRVTDFLAEAPEPARAALLRELTRLEAAYRSGRGENAVSAPPGPVPDLGLPAFPQTACLEVRVHAGERGFHTPASLRAGRIRPPPYRAAIRPQRPGFRARLLHSREQPS
jgi:hypothetical protein